MLNLVVHYKNKYPGGQVRASDQALDVYDANGEHVVALRKDGAGMMVDQSEAFGLSGRHDLSPIPKDARVHKVVNGRVGFDEKHEERKEKRKDLIRGNKILSEKEYESEPKK